jgi:hypothetical protein
MSSHLSSKPNSIVSQSVSSVYLADSLPLDAKTIWQSFESFNNDFPLNAKWNGMQVFIIDEDKWFTYNKQTNTLKQLASQEVGYKTLHIWKHPNNTNNTAIEINDVVHGFVENRFIKGKYLGGDADLVASYDIWEEDTL